MGDSVVSSLTLGSAVRLGCPRFFCHCHKGKELKTHCTFFLLYVNWGYFIPPTWKECRFAFLSFWIEILEYFGIFFVVIYGESFLFLMELLWDVVIVWVNFASYTIYWKYYGLLPLAIHKYWFNDLHFKSLTLNYGSYFFKNHRYISRKNGKIFHKDKFCFLSLYKRFIGHITANITFILTIYTLRVSRTNENISTSTKYIHALYCSTHCCILRSHFRFSLIVLACFYQFQPT